MSGNNPSRGNSRRRGPSTYGRSGPSRGGPSYSGYGGRSGSGQTGQVAQVKTWDSGLGGKPVSRNSLLDGPDWTYELRALSDTMSKEVFRVNVGRAKSTGGKPSLALSIKARVKQYEIDVGFRWRDYYDGGRTAPNSYRVTIPAAMLFHAGLKNPRGLSGSDYTEHIRTHLHDRYRRQAGYHMYFTFKYQEFASLKTTWLATEPQQGNTIEGNRMYHIEMKPKPFSCVYPHLRNTATELVLGLVFCNELPQTAARTRSQGRLGGQQKSNRVSFDMTESFVTATDEDCNWNSSGWVDTLFPEDQSVNAFYVCRGARLLVTDFRHDPKERPDEHCRSLYQQGSVIVIRGSGSPTVAVEDDKRWNWFTWEEFNPTFLTPDYTKKDFSSDELATGMDSNETKNGRNLNTYCRRVYFLGAVESEHNSVCWNINISPQNNANEIHDMKITFPEGGYLEDFTTWNRGWQLIQARHRYERLFESVLVIPSDSARYGFAPVPALPFQLPADDFTLRRMLGIEGARPARVRFDYQKLHLPNDYVISRHDRDKDIRRYIQLKGLSEAANEQNPDVSSLWIHNEAFVTRPGWQRFLPGPPLYPPIVEKVRVVDENGEGSYDLSFRDLGRNHKIVRCFPAEANLDHQDIFSMLFKVVDQTTSQEMPEEYVVKKIRCFGQLWKSGGKHYQGNRIGRDYVTQRMEFSSAKDEEPKMYKLILYQPGGGGWPWDREDHDYYRF